VSNSVIRLISKRSPPFGEISFGSSSNSTKYILNVYIFFYFYIPLLMNVSSPHLTFVFNIWFY